MTGGGGHNILGQSNEKFPSLQEDIILPNPRADSNDYCLSFYNTCKKMDGLSNQSCRPSTRPFHVHGFYSLQGPVPQKPIDTLNSVR